MAARRWDPYINYDVTAFADGSIPVAKLAPLTASRLVVSNSSGVLASNAALIANRVLFANPAGDGVVSNGNAFNTFRVVATDTTGALQTLAAGTQNRVLIGDANGLPVSASAITASRALISDSNGVPTHSPLTAAQLATAVATVSDSSSIDFTLSANDLTGVVKAAGVTAAMLASSAGGACVYSGLTTASQNHTTSYVACASIASYSARKATSRLLILGLCDQLFVSGTSSFLLTVDGSTLVGKDFSVSGLALTGVIYDVGDTSAHAYDYKIKNTTPAGLVANRVLFLIDLG